MAYSPDLPHFAVHSQKAVTLHPVPNGMGHRRDTRRTRSVVEQRKSRGLAVMCGCEAPGTTSHALRVVCIARAMGAGALVRKAEGSPAAVFPRGTQRRWS